MHIRKGTTIIEFLVYFALFSFVIICSISWIVKSHALWNSYTIKNSTLINQCTIFDMLSRDLQSAPLSNSEWPYFSCHEIIWHTGTDTIGWSFKDKTVFRCQGTYNMQKKSWTKKNSTVIAKSIEKLTFGQTGAGRAITLSLTNAGRENTITISLKKGPLPWKRKKVDQPSL